MEEEEGYCILDDVRTFFEDHVVMGEEETTAAVLFAAMTYMYKVGPTVPRMLIKGPAESGKTTAMNVIAALSANPTDADGTPADLKSAMVEAANQPEDPLRTFYYDEITENYGSSGMNRGSNRVLDKLLRRGYKSRATLGMSSSGSSKRFSIFFPVIMTGITTSIPVDIRGRTIVGSCEAGVPRRYFDARESEAEADDWGASLRVAVMERIEELKDFRARNIDARLSQRKLEVWEPLFAVASVLGGQKWLNLCLAAFLKLALASEQVALSPRQKVVRDIVKVLDIAVTVLPDDSEFAGGQVLADELRRQDDYADIPGITQLIARNLRPLEPRQIRVGHDRIRGYYAEDIREIWEEIKPEMPEDVIIPEEEDPFDVTDGLGDDSEEVFEIPEEPADVSESRSSAGKNTERKVA